MNQQQLDEREAYQKSVQRRMPKSNIPLDMLKAFLVGGLICAVGQLVYNFGLSIGLDEKGVSAFTPIVMIFIGSTLTGVGVYDKIGEFAGAGSIVPITGFANSIVSPAMEFRREGLILGVGSKLFSIAGPVLVYGISSSIIAGLIYAALS